MFPATRATGRERLRYAGVLANLVVRLPNHTGKRRTASQQPQLAILGPVTRFDLAASQPGQDRHKVVDVHDRLRGVTDPQHRLVAGCLVLPRRQ